MGDPPVDEDGNVTTGVERTEDGEAGGGSTTPVVADGKVTIRYSTIVSRGGELCLTMTTDRVPADEADAVQLLREQATVAQWESLASAGQRVGVCPGTPGTVPFLTAAVTYAEEVRGRLPRPDLSMPPGSAVAGQPMFLVNDQDLTFRETRTVDLGGVLLPVTIAAVGTWRVVDWGDGTAGEQPYVTASVGHGASGLQVTHTYVHDGEVAVSVVDTWSITVTAPGLPSLTFPPVDLAPSVLPVVVEELQAVGSPTG